MNTKLAVPVTLITPIFVIAVPLALRAQVSVEWSRMQRGVAVAVDRDDNVYTLDHEQQLGAEVVLTKHDADGNFLWSASFDQVDATKWERAQWLAVDGQGDVIVCATLMSGYSNPVVAASITMKFAADGSFRWRRIGGNGFDGSRTVRCVVDRDDNVHVLGLGQSGTGLVSKIEKFAADGTSLWSWFDPVGIGAPTQLKPTPDGGLLVSGRATFGSLNGHAKIDSDGNTVWTLAAIQSLTAGDCAGDAFGNTYVVHGEYGVGSPGTIVRKLAPSGGLVWQHVYPSSGLRIEVGSDDCPIVAGFPSQTTAGAAFFKVDENGAMLWSNLDADGPLALLAHSQLVVDASGDAYLAASTLFEMAVCKVARDGAGVWTATTPGSGALALALSRASNGVFVVGGRTAHLLDASEGQWMELGGGLAGGGGVPRLDGQGRFEQGQSLELRATHIAASALVVHVGGTSAMTIPLFGGILVPSPDLLVVAVADSVGRSPLSLMIPTAVGSGQSLWFQSWCFDPLAGQGWSATNAQRVTGL